MKKSAIIFYLFSFLFFAACTPQDHLTILHTNDTHSQIEPKTNGQCGYARRMGLIEEERKIDKNLLLLDAGDFCQGTPYFNIYHGRVEIDAMNRMRYDAATLGNHEFDNGLDSLATVLKTANFPIVCANYDFTGTALESIIKPFTIVRRGGLNIGIFGLGCDPKGIISDKNFLPAQYLDPYGYLACTRMRCGGVPQSYGYLRQSLRRCMRCFDGQKDARHRCGYRWSYPSIIRSSACRQFGRRQHSVVPNGEERSLFRQNNAIFR